MNRSAFSILGLTAAFVALNTPFVIAAPQKQKPATKPAAKPATKPASKPADKQKGPIVLGTTQLPGDFGQFGQTYTMGKRLPMNFTLKSAEYTLKPFISGTTNIIPGNKEKLLVLHFTLHNAAPEEQMAYYNTLSFTAVDAHDVNHESRQLLSREGEPTAAELRLKPAQKIDVQAVIVVPATDVVPKLIVQRESGEPVIRYDLRGKVAPLPAPFADPSDTTGAKVSDPIPGSTSSFAPMGQLDVRLDGITTTTDTLQNQKPGEGQHFVVANLTLKNPTSVEQAVYGQHFAGALIDSDGEKMEYKYTMLKATRDELVGTKLEPGQELKVRIFFLMPTNIQPKTLKLSHSADRFVAFDLSNTATEAKGN